MADGGAPSNSENEDDREWHPKMWYRTTLGRAIFLFDVLLVSVLVVSTTVFFTDILEDPLPSLDGGVPGYIYVLALLGALGYVFTTLTDDFHRSTGKLIQYNLRLPAALPLAVGIFLFSELILADAAASPAILGGLAFLTGLYVNLAYVQLGALAMRLLPGGRDEENEDGSWTPENETEEGSERPQKGG